MKQFRFEFMDKERLDEWLPLLFDILYTNMSIIAPTGNSYENDKNIWIPAVSQGLEREQRQIIIMYDGETLAGYFQYYINEGVFMVEEIQLMPAYQSTTLLFALFRYLSKILPEDAQYIAAYAHKKNFHSQSIIKKLGMELAGENKNGNSYFYRGDYKKVQARFRKV